MVDEATRKLTFSTPDPFLAEAKKKVPGLWGKLEEASGAKSHYKPTCVRNARSGTRVLRSAF